MSDDEIAHLKNLCGRFGLRSVARSSGVSVQSLAKALGGQPLYESTRRRLRAAL